MIALIRSLWTDADTYCSGLFYFTLDSKLFWPGEIKTFIKEARHAEMHYWFIYLQMDNSLGENEGSFCFVCSFWDDLKLNLLPKWVYKLIPGFPGGAVVENLPANAGDTGSSPGLERSHMPRSSWAREPQLLSLRVWSLCSATREAATVRGPRTAMKSGPRLPQLEEDLAQKRRPNTAKNK